MSDQFRVHVKPLYGHPDGRTARPGPKLRVISADSLETALRRAGEEVGPLIDRQDPRPISLQINVEVPAG